MVKNNEQQIKIMSYNIHKGHSIFNKLSIVEMKKQLDVWNPDILFLQEVQGENKKWEKKHKDWPMDGLHVFLGKDRWENIAYEANALYRHGHHGNAILSKYPIKKVNNYNISTSKFEQRGILHAQIEINKEIPLLHAFCVHLSLNGKGRKWQLEVIADIIKSLPKDNPIILAGDFNDWFNYAKTRLNTIEDMKEILREKIKNPRSYPSGYPLLSLDRIYTRGFEIKDAIIGNKPFGNTSDHSPVLAIIEKK